jgi:hypothetical protein
LRSRGLAAARGKQWDAVAGLQSAVYVDAIRERPVAPRRASAAARADARAEFGAPAVTGDGQQRPFAVPGLRDQPRVGRVLGAVADLTRRR